MERNMLYNLPEIDHYSFSADCSESDLIISDDFIFSDGIGDFHCPSITIRSTSISALEPAQFVSNFLYLRDEFPELYKHGYEAEDLFTLEKYDACIRELGILAEGITGYWLYDYICDLQEESGFSELEREQDRKIDYLYDEKEITFEEKTLLHKIRKARNKVSHFPRNLDYPMKNHSRYEAHELLYDCFRITCSFAKRYGLSFPVHFITPYYENHSEKQEAETPDYIERKKKAINELNYRDIVIYSIIERDGFTLEKYRDFYDDYPYSKLAELFLCLRRKRVVPSLDNCSYVSLRENIKEAYPMDVIEALDSVFMPEYRATLNSLVEKIHQTVGEIK